MRRFCTRGMQRRAEARNRRPPPPKWLAERAAQHNAEWATRCPTYDELFKYLLDELAELREDV